MNEHKCEMKCMDLFFIHPAEATKMMNPKIDAAGEGGGQGGRGKSNLESSHVKHGIYNT